MYREFNTPDCALILGRESSDYELGVDAQISRSRDLLGRIGWGLGPERTHIIRENDSSAFHRELAGHDEDGIPIMRTNRPEFRKMRKMLWDGEANGLAADAIDRIARNVEDGERLIEVIEPKGIMIATVAQGIIRPDDYGIKLIRSEVERAEQESRGTKRRSNNGKYNKAMRGESNLGGGIRPYGFAPGGMELDPGEAEEIRWMAQSVLNHVSVGSITRSLRERNIDTVCGGLWSKSSVTSMLVNPRIAGLAHHKGELLYKDGNVIPAKWPGIISAEDWYEIQEILKARKKHYLESGKYAGEWERKYLGSGIFECGVCDDGTTMFGTRDQYRCSQARHLARNRERVDAFVIARVAAELSSPDAARYLRPRPDTPDIRRMTAEKNKLCATRDGLLYLVGDGTDGTFTAVQVKARKLRIDREIARLEDEMGDLQYGDDPLARLAGKHDAALRWEDLLLEQQRLILRRLVRVIILPARVPKFFSPEEVRMTWLRPGGNRTGQPKPYRAAKMRAQQAGTRDSHSGA